mmetsp:Transcript_1240/g.1441  ORF Transcript_1240/g.1441 Transcript_1240/m.1441 type:complete len:202 (+) Transcript_1240:2791-3396(+)
MIINERGANFSNDTGLPDLKTIEIGLEHLQSYLVDSQGIYSPKIISDRSNQAGDHSNYIMLTYYRNPLNHLFFNESIVLAGLHSFGLETEWVNGIVENELFDKCCYLSELLKYEEFIPRRIVKHDAPFFQEVIEFMIRRRILIRKADEPSKLLLRTSGEGQIVFIQSLIFPMIDSYYVTLIYILTFIKNKGVAMNRLTMNV